MKSVKPEISVVIPAHNEERRIGFCIEALQNQKLDVPFEIVVCDNGSTDQTSAIVKKFNVRITKEKRKGVGFSLRKGVRVTRGNIIAITDADCLPPPDWLERMYEHFQSNREVIAVGGPFVFYDGPWWAQQIVNIGNALHPHLLTASLCGMNMAFRKDAYHAVGGLHTAVHLQADTQLGYRLMDEGKVIFDPKLIMRASGRRYYSTVQAIAESSRRVANAIALRLTGKPFFYEFADVRD